MTDEITKQKRTEFLRRFADLLEEFEVNIDIQDVGGWNGGLPEVTISNWQWKEPVVFTGFSSRGASDIRKEIKE